MDELLRRYLAEGRVPPANQGFGADQALALEAELRLEAQAHFVTLDGAAQFVLQGNALAGLGGEVAGVGFDAVATLGLGAIHGGVGIADEAGDVAAVLGIEADADARAGEELMFAGLEGRMEAGQQFVGDGVGIAGAMQAGQEDDEFVTAQAGYGVEVAYLFLQAVGDTLATGRPRGGLGCH